MPAPPDVDGGRAERIGALDGAADPLLGDHLERPAVDQPRDLR